MKRIFLILSITTLVLFSCVPTKQFDEQSALANKYLAEKEDCAESLKNSKEKLDVTKSDLQNTFNKNVVLNDQVSNLTKEKAELKAIATEERELRKKTNSNYDNYMHNSSIEQESLVQKLAEKERELTKKEINLNTAQTNLELKLKEFQILKKTLNEKEIVLADKGNKIEELQSKINEQNIALVELKDNVKKALKEFTSEDLTVTEKDGKIYVSLSENLLFKSGSFSLDADGEKALIKLSEVLAKQKDVDIVVEGHADSDPFPGKGDLIDNWDLSVKRATSVVRILMRNNVPKNKIVASGRADNIPIADNKTKEGKAKNRRTEIILSPNLTKLMKVLQD